MPNEHESKKGGKKMKGTNTCLNCGKKEEREVYQDELGDYINCSCGSSCDVDITEK